jgi:hypothetical protein
MKQDRDTKIGERAKAIVKAKASMEALRKAQAAPKRAMPKEPTTGGSDTVPMTPERKEFLAEMAKRNAKPGMAKGGKTASCGLKNGGKAKSFAATKFGAAMMKKSADTKGRAMVKKADGGKGYAKGGKVKKASGGVLGGLAPNTAGGTVTRATPGNTLTGVPSPSAPAANTAAPMQSKPMPSNMGASPQERALMREVDRQKASAPPAANTAGGTVTRATPGNTLTGVPSPSAQMQASQPLVSRPRDPTPAPQTASPTKVTPLEALQAKYSSATPNRDKSATITSAGVRTPASFDRNQALRDFNTVGRNFIGQGVPQKAVIQAQGELRKLQMDNSSTPAQHQAAIQSILARMNSLVPKKSSPQVDKRFAKGGSTKAATKSGRALVKKSADTEGRAMKKFAAGGLTSGHKAANGVAKKGLTKGKQVKMNKGGACYAKGGSVRSIDGIATKGKTRCKGARK